MSTVHERSDNLIPMRRLSATEVARRFSQVLDEVEASGERVLVMRHGRPAVEIGPARSGNGAKVLAVLEARPHDPDWVSDLARVRDEVGEATDRWGD
jgi:prevent-host-death family protein